MVQYITQEGLDELKKELQELKTVETKKIAELIRHAASFGDLKENFSYHDAKEKQAFLLGRISELEKKIRSAKIIEKKDSDKVQIGSKVLISLAGEKEEIQIVNPVQANPLENKISYESPLGKAILDKRAGDKVKFETEGNKIDCEILKIE